MIWRFRSVPANLVGLIGLRRVAPVCQISCLDYRNVSSYYRSVISYLFGFSVPLVCVDYALDFFFISTDCQEKSRSLDLIQARFIDFRGE